MKDFPHTQGKEEPGPLLHEFKLYIDLSQFVHSEGTYVSVNIEFV